MGGSSGSRGARTARWLGAVALVLGLVPLLSGCLVFKTFHSATQLNTIGDVIVTSTICTSSNTKPGCSATGLYTGKLEDLNTTPVATQIFLGYRVPAGVEGPPGFTSTGQIVLEFAPSPGYVAELQRLVPAPAGTKWLGYASTTTTVLDPNGGVKEFTVTAVFRLPAAADGGPFATPLLYRPVVGMRGVDGGNPITRPIACDASNPSAANSTTGTVCVSDTGPQFGTSTRAPISSNSAGATRDLGLPSTGVAGTISPGGTVSLPFIARYSGTATAAATFSLSASTTLTGATVIPALASLAPPSNSDTPIPVAVGVPAGAAPGTYDVTLTAKLANGQTRAGVGKLTVVAPAGGGGGGGGSGGSGAGGGGGGTPTAGALKLTIILPPKLAARSARRSGVRVLVGSSARTRATVELFCGKRRAPLARRRSVLLRAPGPVAVTLKSARLRAGACRVVVRGSGFRATKALRLRRP
jgi:hypothetical protein